MKFSLSDKAVEYIDEKILNINKNLGINIYQYTKQGCSGSYLDLYVELDKIENMVSYDTHEKISTILYNSNKSIDVYFEKRIKELFEGQDDLLIDARTHEKFGDKFTELILREHKIE